MVLEGRKAGVGQQGLRIANSKGCIFGPKLFFLTLASLKITRQGISSCIGFTLSIIDNRYGNGIERAPAPNGLGEKPGSSCP